MEFVSDIFKVSAPVIQRLRHTYCDNCPRCNGKRILEGENGPKKCDCLVQFNHVYSLMQAHLPPKFFDLTKKDLDADFVEQNKNEMNLISEYNKHLPKMCKLGKGLFLQGENGSGKTFIATLLLRKALEEGFTGYFILHRDLINAAFAALFDSDVRDDLEKILCDIDFLFIDEIDKIFIDDNAKVQNLLESLLKKRAYAGKPLIVTSNKALDELNTTLGKTIVATLDEDLIPITLVGNYRVKLRQQNWDLLTGDSN